MSSRAGEEVGGCVKAYANPGDLPEDGLEETGRGPLPVRPRDVEGPERRFQVAGTGEGPPHPGESLPDGFRAGGPRRQGHRSPALERYRRICVRVDLSRLLSTIMSTIPCSRRNSA